MIPKISTSNKPIRGDLLLREMPRFGGTTDGSEDEMLGTSGEVGGEDAASVALSGSGTKVAGAGILSSVTGTVISSA